MSQKPSAEIVSNMKRKFARSIILIFDFEFWLLFEYTDAHVPTIFRIFVARERRRHCPPSLSLSLSLSPLLAE